MHTHSYSAAKTAQNCACLTCKEWGDDRELISAGESFALEVAVVGVVGVGVVTGGSSMSSNSRTHQCR